MSNKIAGVVVRVTIVVAVLLQGMGLTGLPAVAAEVQRPLVLAQEARPLDAWADVQAQDALKEGEAPANADALQAMQGSGPASVDGAEGAAAKVYGVISASADHVLNGDLVTATMVLSTAQATEAFTVTSVLPDVFEYVDGAKYISETRTVMWAGVTLNGRAAQTITFQVRINDPKPPSSAKFTLDVPGGSPSDYKLGKQVVHVGKVNSGQAIGREGGRLTLDSTLGWVDVPAGALDQARSFTTTLFVAGGDDPDDTLPGAAVIFSPDTTFASPVSLYLDLSHSLRADKLAIEMYPELVYAKSVNGPATGETMGSVFDPARKSLTAQLKHFSTGVTQDVFKVNTPTPWKMSSNFGAVNTFNGSASYQFPLPVPAMPDGFAPGFSVSYSSAGIFGQDDMQMGYGWGMDVPRISRGLKVQSTTYNGDTTNAIVTDNDYKLNIWGQEYALVPKGGNEYVPESYAAVRVMQCSVGQSCGGITIGGWPELLVYSYLTGGYWCTTNETTVIPASGQTYWQVWMPDGTRYLFGTDGASTKMAITNGSHDSNNPNPPVYSTWYLKSVYASARDDAVAGKKTLTIDYAEVTRRGSNGVQSGYNYACPGLGASYEFSTKPLRVRYGNSQAAITTTHELSFTYSMTPTIDDPNNRLASATIKSGGNTVSQVDFGFITPNSWTGTTVGSITVRAPKADGTLASLPATTFQYRTDQVSSERARMIAWINNGYGGATYFNYWDNGWNGPSNVYSRVNYRIISDTTSGIATVNWYQWDPSQDCLSQIGSSCFVSERSMYSDTQHTLMGNPLVTETTQTAVTGVPVISSVANRFYVDKQKLGKPYEVRVYDGAGVLQGQNTTSYVVTTPAGGSTNAWFVAAQTVTQQTYYAGNPLNQQTNYGYDSYGNTIWTADQGYTTYTGDEKRTVREYYPISTTTQWLPSAMAAETIYADAATNTTYNASTFVKQTRVYYDGNAAYNSSPSKGLVTKVEEGACPSGGLCIARQQMGYDTLGNVVVLTDAKGFATRARYDGTGLYMLGITNTLGQAANYAYYGVNGVALSNALGVRQPYGALQTMTDANGMPTQYGYDEFGRLKQAAKSGDSLGSATMAYTYTDGAPLSILSRLKDGTADGYNQYAFYDGLGRAIQSRVEDVNGQQQVVNTRYNAQGQAAQTTIPVLQTAASTIGTSWTFGGVSTQTSYDALGRTTVITGADGLTTQHLYGVSVGLARHRVVDANNHTRVEATDGLGLVRYVEEYTGTYPSQILYATTYYTYNVMGGLTNVKDGLGNTTVITYDAVGRKGYMSDPDMGAWRYWYDLNNNLTTQTDAKGQILSFAYDNLNRVTQKSNGATVLETYGYDNGPFGVGRRITATVPGVVTDITGYDARGRVVTQTRQIGTDTFTTVAGYDSADRVVSTKLATGEVITQGYNAANQPYAERSSTNALDIVKSATYNALGSPQRVDYGNTLNTQYRYYGLDYIGTPSNLAYGRLRGICVSTYGAGVNCSDTDGTASVRLNLAYAYDSVGNVTNMGDRTRAEGTSYTYDPLDRLVTFNIAGALAESYAYNQIGNITNKSVTSGGGTNTGAYTYTPSKPHAVSSTGNGWTYQYDANGNVITRTEGTQYVQTFNVENQLVGISKSGASMTQAYDADGGRVKKVDGVTTTLYVGAVEVAIASGTRVTTTYYMFSGKRVAMRQGATMTWLYGDMLNSASVAADSSGNAIAGSIERYTPYGEYRSGLNGAGNPSDNRFTDQKRLSNWGVDDFNARMYDPQIGRFISADTIVPQPGDPQSWNKYSYVRNNPIKKIDPSGHCDGNSAFAEADAAGAPWPCVDNVSVDKARENIEKSQVSAAVSAGPWVAASVGAATAYGFSSLGLACLMSDVCNRVVNALNGVKSQDVYNARTKTSITESILNNGIDPQKFDDQSRFGAALYVAESGETAVSEVSAHGSNASQVLRFSLDISKAKVLDLTNTEIAKDWGYVQNPTFNYANEQAIAGLAKSQGYNVIKYASYRGFGFNYALLNNPKNPFDFVKWLIPQMVMPGQK